MRWGQAPWPELAHGGEQGWQLLLLPSRMRRFRGLSNSEDTFELRSKQEQMQVRTLMGSISSSQGIPLEDLWMMESMGLGAVDLGAHVGQDLAQPGCCVMPPQPWPPLLESGKEQEGQSLLSTRITPCRLIPEGLHSSQRVVAPLGDALGAPLTL